MNSNNTLSEEEKKVLEHIRYVREFHAHLFAYIISLILIFAINLMTSPHYLWAMWVLIGWGFGVMAHGTAVFVKFSFFGPRWEKEQVEKILGKEI